MTALSVGAHAGEEFLWPQGAPGALDTANASKPSLTWFPADPKIAIGTSAIICPGGGYQNLATDKEGNQVAKWLNTLGVSAFVLKYRLAPYHHPIEMNDAKRAMRFVRANARRYKIDPGRIALVGFSAGGHLASTVATHFDPGDPSAPDTIDRQSCKPYFQILVYPVITMEDPFAHAGSRLSLLGPNPSADLVRLLSNEKQVTAATPPAYLVHSKEDRTVKVENTIQYHDSLVKAGVPVQMKLFDHGPHGFGLANGVSGAKDSILGTWPALCAAWMQERGYLSSSVSLLDPSRPRKTGLSPGPADPHRSGWFDFLGRWRPFTASIPVGR